VPREEAISEVRKESCNIHREAHGTTSPTR
jgi:hypothetical protein